MKYNKKKSNKKYKKTKHFNKIKIVKSKKSKLNKLSKLSNQNKINLSNQDIPLVLQTFIEKYKPSIMKDMLVFSIKPFLHRKNILLGAQINGLGEILKMPELKQKFKSFFTYDYMNYVNLDENKRRISISTTQLLFNGKPIILEGYLLVIMQGSIFNSYMLDKLKIVNMDGNISSNKKQEYYFPDTLPDEFPKNFTKSLHIINEIINQVYTIMKYIAIIISFSGIKKSFNLENAFEIIKVQFKLYNDNSVILERCIIKKDWNDFFSVSKENRMLAEWLDALIFRPVLGNKLPLELELASVSLFKKDNKEKRNQIQNYLNTDTMTRKDFNNKFIIIASNYIFKKESDVLYNYLIDVLNKYGLKQEALYTAGIKPALMWFGFDEEQTNYKLTLQHYNTLTYTSNYIGQMVSINNKQLLYYNMKKYFPDEYLDFMPESFLLNKDTKYTPGNIYIARPINLINMETGEKIRRAFGGKDILYITSEKTMDKAKTLLSQYDNILISEYIRNPLLIEGKKFHLRVALLITYFNDNIKIYMFRNSLVRTALLPFKMADFHNMDIHDTHFSSTTKDYLFPDDFTKENIGREITDKMRTQLQYDIAEIMRKIGIVLSKNKIEKYYNIKNPFQLEGIDIMITEDFKPILIECNGRAGFASNNDIGIKWQKDFFNFIGINAIAPLFGSGIDGKPVKTDTPIFDSSLQLDINKMIRSDFNNNFVIVGSDFLFIKKTNVLYNLLIKILKKYGLKQSEYYSVGTKPALIWYGIDENPINYSLIAQHFTTLAYVGNKIGNLDSINDKQLLYFNMKKYFPNEYLNFMPRSFSLTKNIKYNSGNIYIARPINEINQNTGKQRMAYAGKDILYITNQSTMNTAIKLLDKYNNVLISEYIRNPLLFNGKKFHLRIAFLITYYNSVLKTYLFDDSIFITAKLPFELDHFDNMDIHDTHFKSSEHNKIFPYDFNYETIGKPINHNIIENILSDVREIMRKVSVVLGNNLNEIYPNLKNSFQVVGIDIMITDDFQPIFIESNNNPGFATDYGAGIDWQKNFFDFIDRNALSPIFGDGNQKTDEPLFVKKM